MENSSIVNSSKKLNDYLIEESNIINFNSNIKDEIDYNDNENLIKDVEKDNSKILTDNSLNKKSSKSLSFSRKEIFSTNEKINFKCNKKKNKNKYSDLK